MDFHGMKRKDLQILCKKHGIPANLKNIEMADRLASLFQKEDEETVSPEEDSVEADDGIKEEEEENVVASRKAKKVRFSPETDNQVFEFTRSVKKNVRTRRGKHGTGKALQEGGSIEVRRSKRSVSKGVTVDGSNGDVSNSVSGIVEVEKGASNAVKVTRRSKRTGSSGSAQEESKEADLIALEKFEDRDVKDARRSTRLAGKIEKSFEEGGASKPVALSHVAKRSKRIGSSGSTQEDGKDTDLNAPERFEGKDIQGGRHSRRLAAKTEKSFEEGGTSKSMTLLPAAKRSKRIADVASKEDEKETGEHHRKDGDSKVEMMRRRSMRFLKDTDGKTNTQDQRRSVRLKASVDNPLVGQTKNGSVKASRVVKETLVGKKMDENLVKPSKRVTRNMKRDRSGEPGMDKGTASNQNNLTPTKNLEEVAHFEKEDACEANVKAGGSSKKSKTMNQECIKDSPSSFETKAAESGMIVEKVVDPTLDNSSQRSNAREINCEPVEGECEDKLERDTVDDKVEVSSRSLLLIEGFSPDSVPSAVSSPKGKLSVPTGHILAKDVASKVIAEESAKTKDEPLLYAPESELKEHSSIAKLANVEEILENSTECWQEIHSSEDDEKGSLQKDVQAENLHGNVSEWNTENNGAEEEMEISKVVIMSAPRCVNLTPEKLLGEYAQLEPEEAERPNVEERSSFEKMMKTMCEEFVKDKPQGMAEASTSTSETKATEPVVISENVLDSTQKVSGDTSAARNSYGLDSELLEKGREEKHVQAMTKKDNREASSLSEFLIERSEVKTCLDNHITGCSLSVEVTLSTASVQLATSNPEADLGLPTGNDIVSAVITEETLIVTPTSELKEHSSVAELAKVEPIQENSAECPSEDEKGSLEKDVQAENLHVNFSEGNTGNHGAEEEMEIGKDSCISVNLTPEKLLDTYTQLVPEATRRPNVEIRISSKKMETVCSEFVKENTQGMVEDSPSTFVTKTAETITMSEIVSVDTSLVRNTQELNSELTNEEREEKQELDMVVVAETKKDKEKASSPSQFEIFTETTPPISVQLAVSNPESELSVPTGHILAKDIVSAVNSEEDIKTEVVPKDVHSFVSKLAETDAVLENSAECWSERLSSKDDDRGSLEKEEQSAKRHGNFSEYNAENSSAEKQPDICKVGRISDGHCVDRETLDEVTDESLMKFVQTISSERGCKPNALELSGSLSTDFASLSPKEEKVSECLEQEEMEAISQPKPINKAASNALDMSSVFTTPERNLMLMEQLSESGKIREADIVTQHNDEAVESHAVVFTTPEKALLLGDSGLDEVGKEEEHTITDFPDDLNTTQNEAFNEGERIVVELHEESNIPPSPLSQSSVGDVKEDSIERNEENRTIELHCESGTCTGPDEHAALVSFEPDEVENSGGNKAMEFYEESVVFTGLEERHELFGYSGPDKAREGEVTKAAQIYEEAGLSTELHKDLELREAGWLGIKYADESGRLEGQLLYIDPEQKKAVKPAEKAAAEFHEVSAVPNIPERHPLPEESELDEATKSKENNALELQADCDNFTGANITAKSHDMKLLGESNTAATCEESSVFISPEIRQQLCNSKPHTAGKQEPKEVEFKDESAFFTRPETRLLLGESGEDRLNNGKSGSAQYQSHHASSPKGILKDDSVVRESHVAAPDFKENTIDDFSGSITSKVSYSHEFSVGEETAVAEFMPKASQTENVVGLDAIQGTSKQSRGTSPHVDLVNHFDFDTMGADTIMDAERNVCFSSCVLALPAEGNSKTIGEVSNHIEVAGTCSLVSDLEESGPSIDIQNHIHDAVEELAVTDELIDAKVRKSTQNDSETIGLPAEGDSKTIGKTSSQLEVTGTCSMVSEKSTPFMDIQNHINDTPKEELTVTDNNKADELTQAKVTKNVDSSGGSDVSGETCVLAGTEDEHLGYNSEVTDPVDAAFEKDISLALDESTLRKNMNEEDDQMVKREAAPTPEETLKESSENIGESGTSSSEKQVRRDSALIYRTQVKPKRHDMKENAPNSKIVDNLNVTAPRPSKRQPLQDLRKN